MWSTKNHEPLIEESFRIKLSRYLCGTVKGLGGVPIQIGGTRDHVHLLYVHSPKISLSKFVSEIKVQATHWMKKSIKTSFPFYWNSGYQCFSVSENKKEQVKEFIQNQSHFHRDQTHKDEIIALLQKHHVPFNHDWVFSSSYTMLLTHLVWSTKLRQSLIEPDIQKKLYSSIGEECCNKGGKVIEIGGIEDHVHILSQLPAKISLADFTQHLKTTSTRFIRREFPSSWNFEWQSGYGGFSTSVSMSEIVQKYIKNQEHHHKSQTFDQEIEKLFRM